MDNNELSDIEEFIKKEYNDYDIIVERYNLDDDIIVYILQNNGKEKYIYYNTKQSRPVSNVSDGLYTFSSIYDNQNTSNWIMLHSYEVSDIIRPFISIVNIFDGIVYPFGYDLAKEEIVEYPINELGLIDDNLMKERIMQEKSFFGYEPRVYWRAWGYPIEHTIAGLKGQYNLWSKISSELDKKNQYAIASHTKRIK